MIAKYFFKSLILSVVGLHGRVIDPWMQLIRFGRVGFAEVCCSSDSLLSGAVTSIGGRAAQYSHWNGFDLTCGCHPPCTTRRTQQSPSRRLV